MNVCIVWIRKNRNLISVSMVINSKVAISITVGKVGLPITANSVLWLMMMMRYTTISRVEHFLVEPSTSLSA